MPSISNRPYTVVASPMGCIRMWWDLATRPLAVATPDRMSLMVGWLVVANPGRLALMIGWLASRPGRMALMATRPLIHTIAGRMARKRTTLTGRPGLIRRALASARDENHRREVDPVALAAQASWTSIENWLGAGRLRRSDDAERAEASARGKRETDSAEGTHGHRCPQEAGTLASFV